MEKRFSDMLHKNSQRRYLPKSLTEEILEHKQKVQEYNLRAQIGDESGSISGQIDKSGISEHTNSQVSDNMKPP